MMGQDFENPMGLTTAKGKIRMMSSLLDAAVFPGTQGGPLEHVIAAKAVAFKEALSDEFYDYAVQVVKNARIMATSFMNRGYHVVSGGTDNHEMLIDLRSKDMTGKAAEEALGKADITVNKNMVPFDDKSPFVTSGIRVGTPAVTTRGMREAEMEKIVDLIDTVLMYADDDQKLIQIKEEVNALMANFPLYSLEKVSGE